ncbi:hypothetical protein WR25_13435 [Diploscapter pachys]|uniref:Uncharacterized protein n=1 Tax=Diploscapter pachys TaxID=2018661 RepID=A0A2A2KGF5_9BILA|nr:hypothetical protein WR25_13435 [Diploscapter pachys]
MKSRMNWQMTSRLRKVTKKMSKWGRSLRSCLTFCQSCLSSTAQNNFNHVGNQLRRCRAERTAFDKCFFSTLRASNAIPTASIDESLRPFSDVFVHFRSSLDSCFLRSPFASERSFFAPLLVDDDALYLRTIYTSELSSRLWSLPELNSPRPSLDALAICHVDNFKSHLFGSGNIHTQIPVNNTSSCLLQESELLCYRDTLDRNPDYLQLIYSRDFSLRTCLRKSCSILFEYHFPSSNLTASAQRLSARIAIIHDCAPASARQKPNWKSLCKWR